MGWLRKLVHHPVRTEAGGRGVDDESAAGPCERATLSRWEWEGGAAGAVQDSYTYDVYGKPTKTGSLANEFDFAGQQTDGTGLQYLEAPLSPRS